MFDGVFFFVIFGSKVRTSTLLLAPVHIKNASKLHQDSSAGGAAADRWLVTTAVETILPIEPDTPKKLPDVGCDIEGAAWCGMRHRWRCLVWDATSTALLDVGCDIEDALVARTLVVNVGGHRQTSVLGCCCMALLFYYYFFYRHFYRPA